MADWSDGYVSDIAYSGGIYREQTPAYIAAACLVAGIELPVPPGAPFTYCELGCGLGDTAMVVAAAHPRARVWGFDFNPAHVAAGQAVAERTGLDNITLAERSFEELAAAPPDLPPLDYVTLHGVWSWISPANQAHIVAFLRRHVRPGGVVCVSYNAMPGWSKQVGLQRLLFEVGRAAGGGSGRRIREALAFARRVADTEAAVIDGAWLARLERLLADGHIPYLSHEYLNEHWQPVAFAEVAAALAPAKLSFATSANILDNFPQLCGTPAQLALLDALPPEMRQTALDLFSNRAFRRDIYVRGARPLEPLMQATRIGTQRLTLIVPPRTVNLKIQVPVGKATLNQAFYGPAFAALGQGEASVGELIAAAPPDTTPARTEILGMLIGSRQALPLGEAEASTVARVRRFNRARLAIYSDAAQDAGWLVGARIGSALRVDRAEMLVYEVIAADAERGATAAEADDVAAGVRALLASRGLSLRKSAADAEPDITGEVREILTERVPIWRAAGAL